MPNGVGIKFHSIIYKYLETVDQKKSYDTLWLYYDNYAGQNRCMIDVMLYILEFIAGVKNNKIT